MEPRVQERVEQLLRSLRVKCMGGMVSEEDEYSEGKGTSLLSVGTVEAVVQPELIAMCDDRLEKYKQGQHFL